MQTKVSTKGQWVTEETYRDEDDTETLCCQPQLRTNCRFQVGSDVVLVNVRGHKHFPQAGDHGGRSGNVIDGSLQVGEMPLTASPG